MKKIISFRVDVLVNMENPKFLKSMSENIARGCIGLNRVHGCGELGLYDAAIKRVVPMEKRK